MLNTSRGTIPQILFGSVLALTTIASAPVQAQVEQDIVLIGDLPAQWQYYQSYWTQLRQLSRIAAQTRQTRIAARPLYTARPTQRRRTGPDTQVITNRLEFISPIGYSRSLPELREAEKLLADQLQPIPRENLETRSDLKPSDCLRAKRAGEICNPWQL